MIGASMALAETLTTGTAHKAHPNSSIGFDHPQRLSLPAARPSE
jgi:hypothetical protein